LRRLGFSLAGLGQTDDAIALLDKAVKIERTPENLISLAEILARQRFRQRSEFAAESIQ